ncbi:MAG: hypothetical protein HZA53_07580 [Planctomycetes bacterium]|nr:hypothetical protein [Planctomycetota bacterium]
MEVLVPVASILVVLAAVVTGVRWQHGRARAALAAFAVRRGFSVTDGGSLLGLTFDVRAHGSIDGLAIAAEPVLRGYGRRRRRNTRMSARFGRPVAGRVDVRRRGMLSFVHRLGLPEVSFGGEFSLKAIVCSKETSLARAWLSNDVQRAFVAFPKDALLRLEGNEASVEWRGHSTDAELLDRALELVLVAGRAAREAN